MRHTEPDGRSLRVVVVLRLDAGGRPEGSVGPADGPAAEFVGWLSLMAELRRLAADRNTS